MFEEYLSVWGLAQAVNKLLYKVINPFQVKYWDIIGHRVCTLTSYGNVFSKNQEKYYMYWLWENKVEITFGENTVLLD